MRASYISTICAHGRYQKRSPQLSAKNRGEFVVCISWLRFWERHFELTPDEALKIFDRLSTNQKLQYRDLICDMRKSLTEKGVALDDLLEEVFGSPSEVTRVRLFFLIFLSLSFFSVPRRSGNDSHVFPFKISICESTDFGLANDPLGVSVLLRVAHEALDADSEVKRFLLMSTQAYQKVGE